MQGLFSEVHLNGWRFRTCCFKGDYFLVKHIPSDARSVLFLREIGLKAYKAVFGLALCASYGLLSDVPCIYESDRRTCGCACLSYSHLLKGTLKGLFVVFIVGLGNSLKRIFMHICYCKASSSKSSAHRAAFNVKQSRSSLTSYAKSHSKSKLIYLDYNEIEIIVLW